MASLKQVVGPCLILPTMSVELVAEDPVEVDLAELVSLERFVGPCLPAPSMSEELVANGTVEVGLLTLGAVGAAAMCSLEVLLMEQALPLLAGSSQCHRNLTHRNTGHLHSALHLRMADRTKLRHPACCHNTSQATPLCKSIDHDCKCHAPSNCAGKMLPGN